MNKFYTAFPRCSGKPSRIDAVDGSSFFRKFFAFINVCQRRAVQDHVRPELIQHFTRIFTQKITCRSLKRNTAQFRPVGDADELIKNTQFGSCVFANKPGDGSAREQAASCQKVLGGFANICYEYATKRYRSNCINWGIVPFTLAEGTEFPYEEGDFVFVPGIRAAIESGQEEIPAKVIRKDGSVSDLTLFVKGLTEDEKTIILKGCLMNYYAAQNK